MGVNWFWIWPLEKLGPDVTYMNPKYYGLKIYLSIVTYVGSNWDTLKKTSKNCRNFNIHFWWVFSSNSLSVQIESYTSRQSLSCSTKLCIWHFSRILILQWKSKKTEIFRTWNFVFFAVFWPNTDCLFKKRAVSGIFAITFDRNKIETLGFRHSTEDRWEHPSIVVFIGQYID